MKNTAVIMGRQIVSGISDGLEKDMKLDEYYKMAQRIVHLSGADGVVCAKRRGKVVEVEGVVGDKSLTIKYGYRKDATGERLLSRDNMPVCDRAGNVLTFSNKADCFNYIIMDAAYTLRMMADEA